MAGLCALSERQLQRLFRKTMNCTPSQWLREMQCRLARDLMAQGYSNKAVAAELKFANESHFCREFKKKFGTTPRHFAPRHVNFLLPATFQDALRPGSKDAPQSTAE
jgi:AraC family transcriptional regulator